MKQDNTTTQFQLCASNCLSPMPGSYVLRDIFGCFDVDIFHQDQILTSKLTKHEIVSRNCQSFLRGRKSGECCKNTACSGDINPAKYRSSGRWHYIHIS